MKRSKHTRLQELVREVSTEYSLIRDIVLQAPQVAASHHNSMARMFTQAECKMVAINNILIREVQA